MVVIDAIHDAAVAFYEAHGFVRLGGSRRLVVAMRALASLVADEDA